MSEHPMQVHVHMYDTLLIDNNLSLEGGMIKPKVLLCCLWHGFSYGIKISSSVIRSKITPNHELYPYSSVDFSQNQTFPMIANNLSLEGAMIEPRVSFRF